MWQSSDPLQTAAVDVANAVFPYDYRGVRPALDGFVKAYLTHTMGDDEESRKRTTPNR